jgi:hypothetical protein
VRLAVAVAVAAQARLADTGVAAETVAGQLHVAILHQHDSLHCSFLSM